MGDLTADDVIKEFQPIINTYTQAQMLAWSKWETILPEMVAYVSNGKAKSGNKKNYWDHISLGLLILSALTPIIIQLLIEFMNLPQAASIIDALFPTITTIIQRKTKYWPDIHSAFCEFHSPYHFLLYDIIFEIKNNSYINKKDTFEMKWNDYDNQMREKNMYSVSYDNWYD